MHNKLKEILQNGNYALGGFLSVGCPAIAEVVAVGGLDFIVIDTEHGDSNFETVINMNRSAMARGISTIVRVTDFDQKLIGRYLDNGIDGIQCPMVEDAERAAKVVAATKYEPLGTRGSSSGRGSSWGHVPDYKNTANKETMAVCMCETAKGVDNIEQIVKVPLLDVVFIGLGDLSQSMHCKASDPQVQDAVKHILRVCQEAKVTPGIVSDGAEKSIHWIEMGFRYVTVLNDMKLMCATTEGITKAIRARTGNVR